VVYPENYNSDIAFAVVVILHMCMHEEYAGFYCRRRGSFIL